MLWPFYRFADLYYYIKRRGKRKPIEFVENYQKYDPQFENDMLIKRWYLKS